MHRITFPYKQINADRPKSTPVFLTAIAQHSLDGILHNSPVGNDAPHQRLKQRINAPRSPSQ
jgi:hypothetical protein